MPGKEGAREIIVVPLKTCSSQIVSELIHEVKHRVSAAPAKELQVMGLFTESNTADLRAGSIGAQLTVSSSLHGKEELGTRCA